MYMHVRWMGCMHNNVHTCALNASNTHSPLLTERTDNVHNSAVFHKVSGVPQFSGARSTGDTAAKNGP